MKRAPKHKRRQSGKRRIDTVATNRLRVTVKDGKLRINGTAGTVTDVLPAGFAEAIGDKSDCLDGHVMIARRSERVLVSVIPSQSRRLAKVAEQHDVELVRPEIESGRIVAEARGDDLASFIRHCAGVSRMDSFRTWLAEIPEASTGTDSHHRYCLENGLSDMPKRIDYSAGRNQPKASYATDGRYTFGERGFEDTRNDNKRAGEYAPRVAHTEH